MAPRYRTHHNPAQHITVQHNTSQYTAKHGTALQNTAQPSTSHYSTGQHHTANQTMHTIISRVDKNRSVIFVRRQIDLQSGDLKTWGRA